MQVLSERARVVQEVGEYKRERGLPVYVPHREREVIDRALQRNTGPLPARTVEAIYRELMSGSFALELPPRIAFLGPQGTFSHQAAVRHFGSSVEYADLRDIDAVFREVAARRCDYAVVPYENSIGGSIHEALDAFLEHPVCACAEALVEVSQALLANCAPGDIDVVYSKAEAFGQCRKWLTDRLPNAKLVPVESTAAAVLRVAEESGAAAVDGSMPNAPAKTGAGAPGARCAAIGSALAGQIYGVNVLFDRIADRAGNITRFLVISQQSAQPTGDDKTSVAFTTAHRPGALVEVLDAFRRNGVNLSHIEKRPSRQENWQYTFFIDCDAHQTAPNMIAAMKDAKEHCVWIRDLGSYPRAVRTVG
ncbi:MAG: bifunctional chorismate mutase/prephenate dehydratase [Phycisphaerae bacterium]|nr:bifunctional chorismate mutase/prephenate dehydratase [Phycisphaerae bacterium]